MRRLSSNRRSSHTSVNLLKLAMLLILIFSHYSCIDEYWPEISDYQNLLVVDGMITSGPGPFKVDLSLSTDVNNSEYIPYRGCDVKILDDDGGIIDLQENGEGSYSSAGNGEKGVVGRSYKLVITTPSGKHYESEFDELVAPTTIDSIYPVLETKMEEGYDYDLTGYQFYLDSRDATEESTYYYWKLEHTYEYNSDFYIHFIYNGSVESFYPTDSLYSCWMTEKVHEIFVFGTTGLSSPTLEKYPLNYVSTETRALSVRYSLLVNQYTIGEVAYRFWQSVAEQNSGESSLYTQQLYQIRGNVKNISNTNEPVLGYFTVAGKDSKRIFTNPPQEVIDFNYPVCVLGDGDYDAYKYIRWTPKSSWPLYVVRDSDGYRALPQQICTDCRKRGGTIQKPEFWIDKQE